MIPDPASRLSARLRPPSLRLGLGLGLPAGGSFDPSILFANGEQGTWFDPSDLSTVFSDTAGTTPATVGGTVARINDKSGRGNHATQATAASRPILRQSGNLYYLEFDGTDDFLSTSAINFSGSDKVTLWAGVRNLVGTSTGSFTELTADHGGNNGGFGLMVPSGNNNNRILFGARGTVWATAPSSPTFAAPFTAIATGQASIAEDSVILRTNGATISTSSDDLGTGNFANAALYMGRRGGASLPFNGYSYGLITRGGVTTPAIIAQIERYMANKTGVAL